MNKNSWLIISAAACWGTMGVFSGYLSQMGFAPLQISALRVVVAAVLLAMFVLFKDRSLFAVKLKDLPLMALTGSVSIYAMSYCYLSAIAASSLSTAAILLYTAPFFVTVAAAVIYHEKITARKLIALLLAFAGCVLIAGVSGGVTIKGAVFGVLSGVTYASYSIFSKPLLVKYNAITVTLWAFLFAALVAIPVANPVALARTVARAEMRAIGLIVLMGLVTAVIPFLLYTRGLSGTEPGKASIMATFEPFFATLFGMLFFLQIPGWISVCGMLLVLVAVIVLNCRGKKT